MSPEKLTTGQSVSGEGICSIKIVEVLGLSYILLHFTYRVAQKLAQLFERLNFIKY